MNHVNAEQITQFLHEDLGTGDLTAALIPASAHTQAQVITREAMIVCGQAWFNAVFTHLNPAIEIIWQVEEAAYVPADTCLCKLSGNTRAILSGERTALNILQTLSATATTTKLYVDAIQASSCKILDTRKTIPGLRQAQKYAVTCGGGVNHRHGLYDAVLIKENHIASTGSIAQAIQIARSQSPNFVEVEVENLHELEQALAAQADRILLDNFSISMLRKAVKLNSTEIPLEASGDINLANINSIAATGVDFIAIGALTKNLQAINLSLQIIP